MVTPVGLSTEQTAASIRAGISRLREIEGVAWCGTDGEPYRGGFLPDDALEPLHRKTHGLTEHTLPSRLIQIAARALRETIDAIGEDRQPIVIVGVDHQTLLPEGSPALFLDNLMRQARRWLDLEKSEVVTGGGQAGLRAVERGKTLLESGITSPIIAGGVESFYDFERMLDLDFDGRILNGKNLDGFLPGEGAAFLALGPADRDGVALGDLHFTEPGSESPRPGDKLSATFEKLFAESEKEDLPPSRNIFCNLNGEARGAKEWGIASMRHRDSFSDDALLSHPAEHTGDMGAAMGPFLIALADCFLRTNRIRGRTVVWCNGTDAVATSLEPGSRIPAEG